MAHDGNNLSIPSGATGFFVAREMNGRFESRFKASGLDVPLVADWRALTDRFGLGLLTPRWIAAGGLCPTNPKPRDRWIDPMQLRGVAAAATADWRPIGRWGPTGSEVARWWRFRDPRDGKDRAIWGLRRRIGKGTNWQVV
jgi:hypothetical protein